RRRSHLHHREAARRRACGDLTAGGDPVEQRPLRHSAAQVLFGSGGRIASTVYGTVVVMATLTAAYASEKDPWKLATTVAGAVFVLWIAHVYAHTLSEALSEGRQKLYDMGSIARRELGIMLAAAL